MKIFRNNVEYNSLISLIFKNKIKPPKARSFLYFEQMPSLIWFLKIVNKLNYYEFLIIVNRL